MWQKYRVVFGTLIVVSVLGLVLLGIVFRLSGDKHNGSKFGIAGFSPVGFPQMSEVSTQEFFRELNDRVGIYGVHLSALNTGLIDLVARNYRGTIVLVLDHSQLDNLPQLIDVLDKYPNIKYLAIGNEVNQQYLDGSIDYEIFLSKYKSAYTQIKYKFPTRSVFTVLQYETYIKHNQQKFLTDLAGYLDLVGITTYPFSLYSSSAEIPANYFSALSGYKLAVTETGWPSSYLGFNEDSQFEYARFIKNIVNEDSNQIEFANWLFLNDLDGIQKPFDSCGLKDSTGRKKSVYMEWH